MGNPTNPKATVLMPVYNGERFLREAVDSILAQTCTDYEFLIIDDGSSDRSAEIIDSYDDPRIRFIHNEGNLGLIATLNRGMDLARGKYLMRMDCDDISLPERLEKQVAFMDQHPRVGVCGVWYREFGDSTSRVTRCAPDHAGIKCGTFFTPVIGHPTVLLRRSAFVQNGLRYDAGFPHAEDYQLWARALRCFEFANLPELLLLYRVHPRQVTSSCAEQQMSSAGKVRRLLLLELGIEPCPEEFEIHQMLGSLTRPLHYRFLDLPVGYQLDKIDRWLCRLKQANDARQVYPEPEFSTMLIERWVGVCLLNYLSRMKLSPALFVPPALFGLIGSGSRRAFAFGAKRLLWLAADLRLRFSGPGRSVPGSPKRTPTS